MPSTTKLVVSAITGVGVVGGGIGAVYAKQYLSKEAPATIQSSGPEKISIRKQLENKGKKLLINVPSYNQWTIKLSTYQREKDSLSIKLSKEDVETLKSTCESKLSSEFEEQNTKLQADLEKICTVPTNREALLQASKELVNDAKEWEQKAKNYNEKSTGADAISELKKGDIKKEDIENWCNTKIEKDYQDHDDYSNFLRWCVKGVN